MTAVILTQHGSTDGLRFGDIRLGNHGRRYVHDRLSGKVSLYQMSRRSLGLGDDLDQDHDPERIEAARAALDAAWKLEAAA